jgi:hypothetical protein
VRPDEPLAPLGQRVIRPVGQQDRERQVRHEDVATLESLVTEERQVNEQRPQRGVAAEREDDPDERDEVPHDPLGKPRAESKAA